VFHDFLTAQERAGMATEKKKKEAPIPVSGRIICKYCGVIIEVTEKPSIVICPKCGMSFKITKNFKG
jgi:predicted RNA-binding Zn-ribbon protein involved in translation (DUF1610 family)